MLGFLPCPLSFHADTHIPRPDPPPNFQCHLEPHVHTKGSDGPVPQRPCTLLGKPTANGAFTSQTLPSQLASLPEGLVPARVKQTPPLLCYPWLRLGDRGKATAGSAAYRPASLPRL